MKLEIDDASAPLGAEDLFWLEQAEQALDCGIRLRSWWDEKVRSWPAVLDPDHLAKVFDSDFHAESFLLTRPNPHWPMDLCYGFYDWAVVDGREMPVIGHFHQMLFDQRKVYSDPSEDEARRLLFQEEHSRLWRETLRVFVTALLNHGRALRPILAQPDLPRPLAAYLQPFSLFISPQTDMPEGLILSQKYYRKREDGQTGKFWPPERRGIDMPNLGKLQWLVMEVEMLPSYLSWAPAGREFPAIDIPFGKGVVGVARPEDFLLESADGPDGYGLHYSLLQDPVTHNPLMGVEKLCFHLRETDEIFVQYLSLNAHDAWLEARLPDPILWGLELGDRLTNRALSPLFGSCRAMAEWMPWTHSIEMALLLLDLLASATGGLSARQLGLTRKQLEKRLLVADAVSFMHTAREVISLWRSVVDWRSPPLGGPP